MNISRVGDLGNRGGVGMEQWTSALGTGAPENPGILYVHGRYIPGRVWWEPGQAEICFQADDRETSAKRAVCTGWEFIDRVAELARTPGATLSPELELYVQLFRLSLALVCRRDVVAYAAPSDASFCAVWEDCLRLASPRDEERGVTVSGTQEFVAAWLPGWRDERLRAWRMVCLNQAERLWQHGWQPEYGWPQEEHARWLTDLWLVHCTNRLVHLVLGPLPGTPYRPSSRFQISYQGEEEARDRFLAALYDAGPAARFSADAWLIGRMVRQSLRESGWREEWLNDRSGRAYYHLEFELSPPADASASDWTLTYVLAHNTLDIRVPLADLWRQPSRRWPVGPDVLEGGDTWLYPALAQAADVCPQIGRSLHLPAPSSCTIASGELLEFLHHVVPALRDRGFPVVAPRIDGQAGVARVRIKVHVRRARRAGTSSTRPAGWFDLQQLVDFDWSVVLDGQEISRETFLALAKEPAPLVQLGGTWRLVPVQAILDHVRMLGTPGRPGPVSLAQLSRWWLLHAEAPAQDAQDPGVEVTFADEMAGAQAAVEALLSAERPPAVEPPRSFRGSLRHYQVHGLAWLVHLRRLGLGACLADDMGLGKTVQVLAYLAYLQEHGMRQGPHLLICPTSLLQNWKAEAARFTPQLRVYVHHGPARNLPVGGRSPLEWAREHCDLIMTTYATAVRDEDEITAHPWDAILLDEAQNVKNADTKQAQVVRRLRGCHRIALTGTPVENRLEELWSICQFINPGYLGSLRWFRQTFVQPITARPDAPAADRLHRLLKPVLMRRRKTDPAIQVELPAKWEVREYAALTVEQAALYQSVVDQLFQGMDGGSAMRRRGQILAALVRLKQICDHPCLVAGGTADPARSGKLKLLLARLDSVIDEGEAALVFTQFRQMGELLCDVLERQYGWRPRFLHGGLSAGERGRLIEEFQSGTGPAPVLVLSLKAGGVGLNLTRANHVFHFDRWWNPAVEDQATDRVFRIGQAKQVQVHKFVCSGTLEERIDALISSKRVLSSAVVGESEGWLTELDTEALRELFTLDAQVVEAEE